MWGFLISGWYLSFFLSWVGGESFCEIKKTPVPLLRRVISRNTLPPVDWSQSLNIIVRTEAFHGSIVVSLPCTTYLWGSLIVYCDCAMWLWFGLWYNRLFVKMSRIFFPHQSIVPTWFSQHKLQIIILFPWTTTLNGPRKFASVVGLLLLIKKLSPASVVRCPHLPHLPLKYFARMCKQPKLSYNLFLSAFNKCCHLLIVIVQK